MKTERSTDRMGVGVSSVMMILVVLALTALSLLAFNSAKSTKAMTARNVEMTCAYYEAAADIQLKLAKIDEAVLSYRQSDHSAAFDGSWFEPFETGAQWEQKEDGLHFMLEADAKAGRCVEAEGIVYPDGDSRYTLLTHKLMPMESLEDEDEMYFDLIGQN